jgi:hypothetical protein
MVKNHLTLLSLLTTPGAVLPVCVCAARQGHPRHAGHHQEDLHVTQLQDQDVHAGVRSGDPGHRVHYCKR